VASTDDPAARLDGENLRMMLKKRLKEPAIQIRIGLAMLILASLAKWFLHPGEIISEGWTDGTTGFLYGVSIGFMLLGIWRNSRRGRKVP